jgi:Kef-type K+ transport system membrane component KefB
MFILDAKVLLFLQVVVVVGLPLILWGPFGLGRILPLPIIQIFAGIALGPSIFGALMPSTFGTIFGKDVVYGVETLANVALVLFVFLAGCEADRNILRKSASMVVRIGVTGVVLPWALGIAMAMLFLVQDPAPGVLGRLGDPYLFAIAFGLCLSVTALPVLAVVLRELGFNQKPLGTIALAVGAVDDALLWLALAILLPFTSGTGNFALACGTAIASGLATVAVLCFVVTPFLQRLIAKDVQERILLSAAILVLFAAAAFNQSAGLHAAIGAFLTGLLLPDAIREKCEDRLDTPVTLLLLPFLFLSTGLKTDFSFADPTVWTVVAVALSVCLAGKFVGDGLAAFASGQSVGFSVTLATVLQCKGLMEIVIVTILYQKGVIGIATFSGLVIVALLTTALTVPMARLARRVFGEEALVAREKPEVSVSAPAATPAKPSAAPYPVLDFGSSIGAVPITARAAVIGRHSKDDVRIDDVRVSRHHARLSLTDAGWRLDNQTAIRSEPNPILVNGIETEHALLKSGDVISLGGLIFTFWAPSAQPA